MAESIGEGGATGRVIGSGSILDRRVVDASRHLRGKDREVFVWQCADVDHCFGRGRNHVRTNSGLQHRRHEGRPECGIVDRFVLGKITLGSGGTLRVEQAPVSRRLLWRADRRELLEVHPRGLVEAHRRLPRADLLHRAREMRHRVVEARHRAVAGGACRDQPHTPRNLLGRRNLDGANASVLDGGAVSLGNGELRVDRFEVPIHHEADANAGRDRPLRRIRPGRSRSRSSAWPERLMSRSVIRFAVRLSLSSVVPRPHT